MSQIVEQEMKIFKEGDAEVETTKEGTELKYSFFSFVANCKPHVFPYQEITDEELIALAEKSGTFDFLCDSEEDIYRPSDGTPYE